MINNSQIVRGSKPLSRFLTLAGDGTGANNANLNFASPTVWKIAPGPTENIQVNTLLITITGSSPTKLDDYGSIVNGLTNGVTIRTKVNGVTTNTLKAPYKTNLDFSSVCPAFRLITGFQNSGFIVQMPFPFEQFLGVPLVLYGANSDALEVVLNDNFTGLLGHFFTVLGSTWLMAV